MYSAVLARRKFTGEYPPRFLSAKINLGKKGRLGFYLPTHNFETCWGRHVGDTDRYRKTGIGGGGGGGGIGYPINLLGQNARENSTSGSGGRDNPAAFFTRRKPESCRSVRDGLSFHTSCHKPPVSANDWWRPFQCYIWYEHIRPHRKHIKRYRYEPPYLRSTRIFLNPDQVKNTVFANLYHRLKYPITN